MSTTTTTTEVQNVDQNDNEAYDVDEVIAHNNLIADNTLISIVEERKAWEEGAYRTSNQQLYTVLAKCLTYYNLLSKCKSSKTAPRSNFDKFVASNDITFKSSTPLINKVVKCVFYEPAVDRNAQRDRRRISAYSLVLRRAISDDMTPEQLPAFIDENGGIENIRQNKVGKVTDAVKAQQARTVVESSDSYLAVVNDSALMQQFDATDYDKAFVAVVVPRGDGTLEVRQIVKSAAAINSSLATMYKQVVAANNAELVAA